MLPPLCGKRTNTLLRSTGVPGTLLVAKSNQVVSVRPARNRVYIGKRELTCLRDGNKRGNITIYSRMHSYIPSRCEWIFFHAIFCESSKAEHSCQIIIPTSTKKVSTTMMLLLRSSFLVAVLCIAAGPVHGSSMSKMGKKDSSSSGSSSSEDDVLPSGTYTPNLDFANIELTPVGEEGAGTCLAKIPIVLQFDGDISGYAASVGLVHIDGPCSSVVEGETLADTFHIVGDFVGTVNGDVAVGEVKYSGFTAEGGSITGRMVFEGAYYGSLHVTGQINVGGDYFGALEAIA